MHHGLRRHLAHGTAALLLALLRKSGRGPPPPGAARRLRARPFTRRGRSSRLRPAPGPLPRPHRHVQGAGGALSFFPRTASGARSTDRNRQVVSMAGDGGCSMPWGDFLPLVQYDLPVKMVPFDNSPRGKAEWEAPISGLFSSRTTDQDPDVAALVRAGGGYGVRVAKAGQLMRALEGAFRNRGPVRVGAVTDPVALWIPPKTSAETVAGFARSASKIVCDAVVGHVMRMARSDLPDAPRP
ncbi:thiamine pyrophosphate-dependent enzyme [Streptomyces sp. NPDC059752]|uniref:thiamine pyrophosphate-dependent enzyme n=1 Tax=unclassified Streptomyces TaxID=2593676 RepID=UPI003654C534